MGLKEVARQGFINEVFEVAQKRGVHKVTLRAGGITPQELEAEAESRGFCHMIDNATVIIGRPRQ